MEREWGEIRADTKFEKTMAKNFPKVMKDIELQI